MGRTGEDRFAFMVGRKARRREFESRCGYPSWERSQSARAAAAAIALRDADGRCDHYASRSNQACRQRSSFIRFRSASLKRDVEWIHCGALIISDPGSRRIQFLGSRFCSLLASRVRGTLCEERTCSAVPISPPHAYFPHAGMVVLGPDGLTAFEKGRQLRSSHAPVSSLDDQGAWPSGAGEFVPPLRELRRKYEMGGE
jgi:hypothetical protein